MKVIMRHGGWEGWVDCLGWEMDKARASPRAQVQFPWWAFLGKLEV